MGVVWQKHPSSSFILSPLAEVFKCPAHPRMNDVEWSMKGRKTLVMLGLFAFGQEAVARAQTTDEQRFRLGSVGVSLGVGLLNGQSQEKVYDVDEGGRKISQLNWDIKQVPTLHLGLSYQPLDWLSLDASGWTQVAKGDGHMKDYDWFDDDADWTHRSDHPDTRIKQAWQADVAATAWALKRDELALGVVLGYQRSQFEWEARGGNYLYSSDDGYRDISGNIPDSLKGITYRQTYETPYVGLVGIYNYRNWTLESRFKHSQWVKARDYDQHHLRDLTFTGNNGNRGRMQSLALGLSYRFHPQFSVKAGVDYQMYGESSGSTRVKDLESGERTHYSGKSGGQSSRTVLSSLALNYRF
jgi:plasminogen activator